MDRKEKFPPHGVDHGSEERNREKRSRFPGRRGLGSKDAVSVSRVQFSSFASSVCILTEGAHPSPQSILIRDYERRRARKLRWTDNDGVHRERVGFQIHRLWNCLICPLYTPSSAVSVSLISIETRIDPSTR